MHFYLYSRWVNRDVVAVIPDSPTVCYSDVLSKLEKVAGHEREKALVSRYENK
jgi:hypothetical protein